MVEQSETEIVRLVEHDADAVRSLQRADLSMKERVPFDADGKSWLVTSVGTENHSVVIRGVPF